jgi:hypothetical protein
MFDFDNIPAHLCIGEVELPNYTGKAYIDTELSTIDLKFPEATNWVAIPPTEQKCETVAEPEVIFKKYRWTRDNEIIEYWFGEYDLGIDMFFAYKNGDDYTIIYCIAGHPGICTPKVNWGNSDGSTDAPEIQFSSVKELIKEISKIGIDFVGDQSH